MAFQRHHERWINPHLSDYVVLLSVCKVLFSLTADREQRVGLVSICVRHTLQGVVLSMLLGDIQPALHLTSAEGWLCQQVNLRGFPLGRIGQLWAPVDEDFYFTFYKLFFFSSLHLKQMILNLSWLLYFLQDKNRI